MKHRLSFAVLLAGIAGSALADETAAVTPYRPSVSTPAQLPAVGQLEYEAGFLDARGHGERRDSMPVLFKLAFSEQWGVLFGGDAYVSSRDADGTRARGLGDTQITLKRAFVIDSATAFGLEFGAKLPTAKDSIGSGKADYTVNTIYSHDIGKVHMDANANLTRLGAQEEGASRNQYGLSASFSVPVSGQWAATAELSGTRRAGAERTAQVLLAAAWSPTKRLTIDFGVAHGLTSATPEWSLFSGLVVPLTQFR
ncbi:transporter [Massilia sp. R2A-15]|uniref:transporter n=1 Tax=Massilia sp. R2A-15 TaxID=3064278 RepID=UPI00273377EF|nr:transporter [Massilia sp. R2A-15]WLI91613.1 transporter [Massilia sp. R2A-15]